MSLSQIVWTGEALAAGRHRIVSLAPSTTEILFALGAGDEVVGVSQLCDYPDAAVSKEKVGTFSQPNIEKIISLKPDIIFCTGLEQAPVITKLRQLGLHIFVSDPSSFEDIFLSIQRIGELIGRSAEASLIISRLKEDFAELARKTAQTPENRRPGVYVEIWHSPIMTAGKGSFLDEMISAAGGKNIAGDIGKQFCSVSPEVILERDPDFIFLAYMENEAAPDAVLKRPGWQNVSAVKNGRVYSDIEPNTLLRPGPRLVEGARKLQERLYHQDEKQDKD
ncbi:MAG: cobalamin-binding protein [Candidatus Omnitrophica bacterium]|nr:cobalamin-binding protein [Candidatus Omnitrophota bacterium]